MKEMYAIVEIAGQQFKVEEGKKIFVHRLETELGQNIDFDQVLLIEDNDRVIIGEPTVKDAVVEGKILSHVRGDKVIVFKKKRKKGYRVKNGHRQNFTEVEIVNILTAKDAPRKAASVKEVKKTETAAVTEEPVKEKKVADKKVTAKKATAKKEETPAAETKKSTPKKSTEKKPAAKKATKAGKE